MVYRNAGAATARFDDCRLNRSLPPNMLLFPDPAMIALGRQSLEFIVENFEKGIIVRALEACRGNQTKAAQLLLTTKRVIQYKVKKYRIDFRQYRKG